MDTLTDIETRTAGTYKKFYHDFQEWVYTNNVLVAAAGFCIGVATKELIERVLNELVRPVIYFILRLDVLDSLYEEALKHVSKNKLAMMFRVSGNLTWAVAEWTVIIFMTFVVLEYLLSRSIIGLKTSVKREAKPDFVKAKVEAGENIIPTTHEVQKLDEEIEGDIKDGKKIIKAEKTKAENTVSTPSAPPSRVVVADNIITDKVVATQIDQGVFGEHFTRVYRHAFPRNAAAMV